MGFVGLTACLLVGASMLSAGVAKLRTGRLARDLGEYKLLPASLVAPVAAVLPWAEVGLGTALLVGIGSRMALFASAGLLLTFATGMSVNLGRGRRISCGCAGTKRLISVPLVLRNLLLSGLALVAATAPPSGLFEVLRWPRSAGLSLSDAIPGAVAVGLGILCARVLTSAQELDRHRHALQRLFAEGPS